MSIRQCLARIREQAPEDKSPRTKATTNRVNARITHFSFMKRLVMFAAFVVLSGTSLFGQNHSLKFDSLPSAQGWTYTTSGPAESSFGVGQTTPIFSVDGTTLHQNTIGTGLGPGGTAFEYYILNNADDATKPFTLNVRSRVLQSERLDSGGFSFGVFTGIEAFEIFMDTSTIQDSFDTTISTSINTTAFHEYRLEGTPGIGYRFFVDGSLVASGLPKPVVVPNQLFIGDSTSGGNAKADVTSYIFSQSARRAYISNAGSNSVSAIDPATNTVVATVPVGRNPVHVAVTPDGARAYVTNAGDSTVSVINTTTDSVVATVQVGFNPVHAAVTPNGNSVYVTNAGANSVSVISTATNTVAATIGVGANPVHVAIAPDGSRAYVTNTGSNNVSVIDTATNSVITTVPVGRNPVNAAVF